MEFDNTSDDGGLADIPTRPMRVKVLYSFDAESKTNCLARFPNTLQIPAVAIDESSQVGVIELQQCIQAITAASPELVSGLSTGDFTVYAYDYSEYDTPLVGQGMLSAALSAQPTAEKAMITGRICKNIPALFSNGVKETLEVKLRLVPVPRRTQNDFSRSMESLRSMSPATSAGFDPNAWNATLQQNKVPLHGSDYFDLDSATIGGSQGMSMVEDIFGLVTGLEELSGEHELLSGVGVSQTPTESAYQFNPAFSHSAAGSRVGSPMMGPDSSFDNELLRHQSNSNNTHDFADQSRPGSRASVRSEVRTSRHQRQASNASEQQPFQQQLPEVQYNEDGTSRKRAKVTQTDWRGKSSFGPRSADLRVTAATTASLHMHRPVAKRPSAPGTDLEPPPRVPTPVPHMNPMHRPRAQQGLGGHSMLRQASTVSVAKSEVFSDMDQFSDALMSSPEEDSPSNSVNADGTPLDIPSSPPVLMGTAYGLPSSPGLSGLPSARTFDSGYMSGQIEAYDDDDNEDRSPDAEDYAIAAQYSARIPPDAKFVGGLAGVDSVQRGVSAESDGQGNNQGLQKAHQPKRPMARAQSSVQLPANDQSRPRGQAPVPRRSSLALPPRPAQPGSDAADGQIAPKAKRKYTRRGRTDTAATSEAGSPAPSDTECRPRRTGAPAPDRSVVITNRLEQSIANGEIPKFCVHCGAIQTPTWRTLWVKEVNGKPGRLDTVEGEGETIAVESLDVDKNSGETTRFVVRKSMKKTKNMQPGRDFDSVSVCNPCGLWFIKYRAMRPSSKWAARTFSRKKSRAKGANGDDAPATDGIEPPSDAFFTDQIGPEDAVDDTEVLEAPRADHVVSSVAPTRQRPRASSMRPPQIRRGSDEGRLNASQLNAALTRQVQSSPVRSIGSQHSPIEINDITPKPTRRLLFPSPRRDGEVKSLDDNGQASLHATPPSNKGSAEKPISSLKLGGPPAGTTDVSIFDAMVYDKENMAPGIAIDEDDLSHLFEGSPTAFFKTPLKTPPKETNQPQTTPRSQRPLNNLLKTPTQASRKRKALSPNPNAANGALPSTALDFMTSPASSRYFLRSTPSRADRTPGGVNEVSPFSRHLAQMLSDANDQGAGFGSPSSGAFDFSDLPTFTTPGRALGDGGDWGVEMGESLSSEFAAFDGESVAEAQRGQRGE